MSLADPIAEQSTPENPVVELKPKEKPEEAKLEAKVYNPASDDKFIRDAVNSWTVNDMVKYTWIPAKQNLYINADGTNKLVAITADYISVGGIGFANVSLSLNMGTTGENALDTGTIANDAWYAIWLITTSRGEKLACTAHVCTNKATRDTVPSMPAGYTIARRIGMVIAKNDHSTILATTQLNDMAMFYADTVTAMPGSVLVQNIAASFLGRVYDGVYAAVQVYYDPC